MGNRVFNLAGLIVIGVIVAALVANPTGTGTLITGVTGLWSTSVNGLLGKPAGK
jgi:hypothetical protein